MGRAVPPIGTPGSIGGGAGRNGALYTGRGPVCGTIMRGTGGGGGTGRAVTGAAGEGPAATIGGAAAGGTGAAGGGAGRGGGALTGDAGTGSDAAGGATTERTGMAGGAGCAITGAGGGGATGFVTGGKTTAGFSGGAAASFFCVIAFSTSPGREMCDRSILVLISSSPRSPRELDLPAGDEASAEERRYTRTFSASCSSRELECVFFSVTPTSGSVSSMALLFTSSSRARSLIRTLLIRPFVSPCCS
jgi:hypothetical protein